MHPEVRPLSTATTHAEAHPSLQGSPIWPNSSESALVRYDARDQMGNTHDAGLPPSPSPGHRVGPVVSVFPADFLLPSRELHCQPCSRPSFLSRARERRTFTLLERFGRAREI